MNEAKVLTKKHEQALFEKFRNGDEIAGTEIALAYRPLIESLASRYCRLNQRIEKCDLCAAGFHGFMVALRNAKKTFNPRVVTESGPMRGPGLRVSWRHMCAKNGGRYSRSLIGYTEP